MGGLLEVADDSIVDISAGGQDIILKKLAEYFEAENENLAATFRRGTTEYGSYAFSFHEEIEDKYFEPVFNALEAIYEDLKKSGGYYGGKGPVTEYFFSKMKELLGKYKAEIEKRNTGKP